MELQSYKVATFSRFSIHMIFEIVIVFIRWVLMPYILSNQVM